MDAYEDNSFLMSCDGIDAYGVAAGQWLAQTGIPLCFTAVHALEVRNVPARTTCRLWARCAMVGLGLLMGAVGASALAGLTWTEGPGFRSAPLSVPSSGRAGLTLLSPTETGVRFTNDLSDADLSRNQLLEVGSGVALGDVDGDGLADLYLCSMRGGNRLYRNRGDWKFEDVTAQAGVACEGQFSTGTVLADGDGDGDLDLLVNGIGSGTRLFENQGAWRFREAAGSGLARGRGSTSMTLADIDGDGFLDLYVANYATRTIKDSGAPLQIEAGYQGGRFVIRPSGRFEPIFLRSGGVSLLELGEADVLYRNTGRGGFAAVEWTDGTFVDGAGQALPEAPKEWGLSALLRDMNGDGAPDLYVCNDFYQSYDRFWLNDGSGRFRPLPPGALRHTSMSSMALDVADLDRDGHDDFLVLDMMSRSHEVRQRQRGSSVHLQADAPIRSPDYRPEYPRNMLFWNRGDGTYSEIAQFSGVDATDWSWSVAFVDLDLDGYEDVLIANGTLRDANDADIAKMGAARMDGRGALKDKNLRFRASETANLAFRNRGDLTFQECGREWGFDAVGIAHGMALADLDNDGDLDVVVNSMRQPAGLYRNDSPAGRIAVRAVGRPPNGQGIGARIELRGGAVPSQSQQLVSGGRYLSGDDPLRVFATGGTNAGMTLTVRWRNGTTSIVEGVRRNHVYEVREAAAGSSSPGSVESRGASSGHEQPARGDSPWFENVSQRLRQGHTEVDFDDAERQPTLQRRFSRLGPGVAWHDLDGDGRDELVLGGGRGGFGVVYLNDGRGGFLPTRRREPLSLDQTTVLAITGSRGAPDILAGLSNYESPDGSGGGVVTYDLGTGGEQRSLEPGEGSIGPLALGVIGSRQALFVGGRLRPGRYPEAAASQVYLREERGWVPHESARRVLQSIRMASGATWVDVDADGYPELVVACDWGPIRVFGFARDEVVERTRALGLEETRGWWNGVAGGDFDEDGRLDLLASNWGRNTRYERHRGKPIRLYYGERPGGGGLDAFEAAYDSSLRGYVPWLPLDVLRSASPGRALKFPTFAAYSTARIDDVFGGGGEEREFLEAEVLETTLFLNRGDHFEARPLPLEAQLTPAFGVSVADVDGDGHEDAFLSQNLFDVDGEISRYDAGRGLLLLGDGRGGLVPVAAVQSGIRLDGEQRGSAWCDFDQDGRVDLAVGVNQGPAGLFRNIRGRPGLRVRLRGPDGNRDAVGATVQLRSAGRWGPARAVQVGSGYWSQDSAVLILGGTGAPEAVRVRWPGGRLTETPVGAGATEVVVGHDERSR